KIKYLYYNQADVHMSNEIIQQKVKPMHISSIFKLHAIRTYYCNGCLVNPQTSVHDWQVHVICRRQDEEVIDTNGTLMPTLEVAAVTSDQEEVFEYERIQYSNFQSSRWVSAVRTKFLFWSN
ncbi:hypothetical protein ACJMK2_014048, partial [Sinanodonta woodiana]